MKPNMLLLIVATLFVFVNPVRAIDPLTKFPLSTAADGVVVEAYIGALPRENPSNLALQGETWATASSNWMTVIRSSSVIQLGSDYSRAAEMVAMDPSWMVTSSFRSWNAQTTSVAQFGNRTHFGLRIYTTDAQKTFRMQDVSCRVRSYIYSDSLGWYPDGVVDISTTLAILNSLRIRLEPGVDGIAGTDDDVLGVQNSALDTRVCAYCGLGVAMGAYGTGSDQDKLNNVLGYCLSKNLVLRLTVTVPYVDGGAPKTLTRSMVTIPQSFVPEEALPMVLPPVALSMGATQMIVGEVGNSPLTNGLYVPEKAFNLQGWTQLAVPDLGGGDIKTYPLNDISNGSNRQQYRIRRLIPAAQSSLAARNVRNVPVGKPTADVVAP